MAEYIADPMIEVEFNNLKETFSSTKGSVKDKIDAAYARYLGFPIMSEAEFWKHMAYSVGDSEDIAARAMRQQHEEMLAFKFELEKREKEFGFEHKSPTDIIKQWEDHKVAVHAKLDELRKQREKA